MRILVATHLQGMHPDYSIIVPTYRRREPLARCLDAIEALDFPRDRFELVVVDDGSLQPPSDLVSALDRSLDAQLVCASHAGPAAARNTGARAARGRYLVFTDDDCAPRADWLTVIDRCVSASPVPVAIGGHTVNVLADNVYASASQSIVDFLYEYYGEHTGPRQFFTSNNLTLPRDEFIEIGGFDEGFELAAAEDRDLCERWKGSGRELLYVSEAIVDHAHSLTFARFNRQHFVYGRGAFDLHRSRARRGNRKLRLEPGRFYYGLITYPLRQSRGWRQLVLAFLHLWSQVAYAAGYFFERIRRGWSLDSGDSAERAAARKPAARGDVDVADEGSMSGAA